MRSSRVLSALLLCCVARSVVAAEVAEGSQPSPTIAAEHSTYYLQPGDVLDISVWKESDLQKEILVRPDGSFTFPLVGEVDARGKSVEEVRATLADRLKRYVPTPVVTVAVKVVGGNRIYVLGRVNHAGEFTFNRAIDVMQAISLAGGTTPFAALNDIVILHRHNGQQQAFKFHYPDVARGRELSQNIELESGDTVVVP
jgi:polysaccharide export outer membrane protein